MCFMEKKYVLNKFVQVWIMELSAISSMLMSPQYIINKLSLNRNTHKFIYWLVDDSVLNRGSQEHNPVFPLRAP